jgi:hypothetical protein
VALTPFLVAACGAASNESEAVDDLSQATLSSAAHGTSAGGTYGGGSKSSGSGGTSSDDHHASGGTSGDHHGSGGTSGGDDDQKVGVCVVSCKKSTKSVAYKQEEQDDAAEAVKAGGALCAGSATNCCLPAKAKNALCTDFSSDPANCGACGVVCPAGELCQAGTCACPGATTSCGGSCVDTSTDPDNCGTCGNACFSAQSCVAGACTCPGTTVACSGACVDTTSDSANCGACGNACAAGASCVSGACVVPCPAGQAFCGGACVNVETDAANCGACGDACAAGNVCQQGTCVATTVAASCLPTSSLTVLVPAGGGDVNAYVPNGSWTESRTGVQLVPLEGGGVRASIATPNPVNSCASNAVTGETVCTANNNDVYLISGSSLTATLSDGATGSQGFSGGSCATCGVSIDGANNRAVLMVGVSPGGPGGFEFLDLSSNAFSTPVGAGTTTSENTLFDPQLDLLLSPNEAGDYVLYDTKASAVMHYAVPGLGGEPDSAAEDCSTGIALASVEFTGQIVLVDLTQRTASSTTWSAPTNVQLLPEFAAFSAGTSGIAMAPGSHVGVVAGEFGGSGFGAIRLPSVSGSGTPSVVDYVAANVPNDPSGGFWQMGLDPHTLTAYTSPNTGKSLAVIANDQRTYLALVDLEGLLGAARTSGTHSIDPTVDLVGSGIVRFVSIP